MSVDVDTDVAHSRGDIMRELRELRREVNALQTARRLEAATIGAGGLAVRGGQISAQDETGQPQVRMGPLTDGGFGLEQRIGATWVPLAALAGGAVADVVGEEGFLAEDAGTDTGFVDLDTIGPSVTFTTHTGKWLLLLIAQVGTSGDRTAGRMGYVATGAQTVDTGNSRSSLVNFPDLDSTTTAVFANQHTGTPGEITVTVKYRLITPTSFSGSVSWDNRAAIVIPY